MYSVTRKGFTVGDFQVEPELCVILGPTGAHFVHIPTIRLLMELARYPGQAVPRRQLTKLWPDHTNAETALTRAIACLRHSFGDNARLPRYVETVPRVGYRLLAPVTATRKQPGGAEWRPARPSALQTTATADIQTQLGNFFRELRQRKVFGASIVYAVVIWLVFQVAEIVFPALGLPEWALRFVVLTGILGFPVVAVMSWIFDVRLQQAGRDRAWEQDVPTSSVSGLSDGAERSTPSGLVTGEYAFSGDQALEENRFADVP